MPRAAPPDSRPQARGGRLISWSFIYSFIGGLTWETKDEDPNPSMLTLHDTLSPAPRQVSKHSADAGQPPIHPSFALRLSDPSSTYSHHWIPDSSQEQPVSPAFPINPYGPQGYWETMTSPNRKHLPLGMDHLTPAGGPDRHKGEGFAGSAGVRFPRPRGPQTAPAPRPGSFPRCDVTPARSMGGRVRSRRRTARPHPSLPPASPGSKMAAAAPPHPRTNTDQGLGARPTIPGRPTEPAPRPGPLALRSRHSTAPARSQVRPGTSPPTACNYVRLTSDSEPPRAAGSSPARPGAPRLPGPSCRGAHR